MRTIDIYLLNQTAPDSAKAESLISLEGGFSESKFTTLAKCQASVDGRMTAEQ